MTQLAKYCWAAPYSLLGLAIGLAAFVAGATPRVAAGAIEVGGGWLGRLLRSLPPRWSFSAITFGHVILGTDHATLAQLRDHEQVHVRQYERWGPLYIPAYVIASLVAWLSGRHPYLDNHFEREAYAHARAAVRRT